MPFLPVLLSFPFVHPGLAGAALLAGLIPIVIHLIHRRRYVRTAWAAMALLWSARRRTARRVRLEQFLLLTARLLLILLAGFAIARPYLPASSVFPRALSRTHRILLIDDSLSMRATSPDSPGGTRYSVAMEWAGRLLDSFSESDTISVITISAPARERISRAFHDRFFLREQTSGIKVTQRKDDPVGALEHCLALLRSNESAPGNHSVYLITDLGRTTWQSGSHGEPSAAGAALRRVAETLPDSSNSLFVLHAAGGGTNNVSISNLACDSIVGGLQTPVRLSAQITNAGTTTVTGAWIEFRRDGKAIRKDPLPTIEAKGSLSASATVEFSEPGTHLVEARIGGLTDDGLSEDNVRFLSIEIREKTEILVVDGRPGATKFSGQAGYLVTALSPDVEAYRSLNDREQSQPTLPLACRVITDGEFPQEVLGEYAATVLCNVARLSKESWSSLERFVQGGGGLLVFAGDMLDSENYNAFGYSGGEGVLPGRVLVPGSASGSESNRPPDDFLKLLPPETARPIIGEFVNRTGSGLFTARIRKHILFESDFRRGESVLHYDNGDPALIIGKHGRGRVAVFTTGANMEWSNLPAKGDFVSLMLETIAYLTPGQGDHRNILVGQSAHEKLSASSGSFSAQVLDSEGNQIPHSLMIEGEGLALQSEAIDRAGPCTLQIGGDVLHFAANVDPAESDLSTMEEAGFRNSFAKPCRFAVDPDTFPDSSAKHVSELSRVVLYAVSALLLMEMWLAMRFGAQRA